MSAVARYADQPLLAALRGAVPPMWMRWEPGPVENPHGPVVVSFTEYVPHSWATYHRFVRDGMRLAKGWYAMEGAVGLYLYGQPLRKRGGSVSVWTSEEELRRFIALPRHVQIMRQYRTLGVIRAVTWTQDRFDPSAVKRAALDWLSGEDIPGARARPPR